MLSVAKCDVLHDILVESDRPVYVDGEMVVRQWVHAGPHELDADLARAEEARGYLLIEAIDGRTAYWSACCADC